MTPEEVEQFLRDAALSAASSEHHVSFSLGDFRKLLIEECETDLEHPVLGIEPGVQQWVCVLRNKVGCWGDDLAHLHNALGSLISKHARECRK